MKPIGLTTCTCIKAYEAYRAMVRCDNIHVAVTLHVYQSG